MATGTPDVIVDADRENLIAEMLRDAKPTELSGDLVKNPVIDDGKSTGAPVVVHEISGAGYVYVWDSRTFEKVPVLYYRIGQVLRKKRPDGSYMFTVRDPGQLPKRGEIKCMLHPESADRKHFDELGFRTCAKKNIINNYELRRHMQMKHPQEFKAINEEKETRQKDEDRALQQALVKAMTERAVPPAPPKPFVCDKCGADFGSQKTLDKHKKECV